MTATPTAITWGCCPIKTSELHYACSDDRVVVKRGGAGIYEIDASACVEKAGGAPTHSVLQLYINGAYVCCSDAHGIIGTAGQHTNADLHYSVYLNEGDYVQIYISQDAGTGTVEDDTGRFCMKRLPMRGWNNDSGGIRKIRGERMR